MTYRKGYFKAMLDILNLLEWFEKNQFFKSSSERWKVAVAVIREVLVTGKLDYFMEKAGKIEFVYHYEKGKVEVKTIGEQGNEIHN